MRVLVLVLAVLAVSRGACSMGAQLLQEPIAGGWSPDIPDAEGGQLVSFLDKLKQWMKTGNGNPEIPVLDPLSKTHLELNIDNKKTGIVVQAALDNLRGLGLSDFVVNKGDFKLTGLVDIDLTWRSIDLFAMYDLIKAKIQPPPLGFYGAGAMLAILKDLHVAGTAKLDINGASKVYVREINLGIQLGQLQFNATGLVGGKEMSQMISKIVSKLVPEVLKNYPNEISKQGGELVKTVLDDVLNKLSWSDLMDLIGS